MAYESRTPASNDKKQLAADLARWFHEIQLTPSEVQSTVDMGVKKRSDLLLFTPQELVTEFGFSVRSVAAAFRDKPKATKAKQKTTIEPTVAGAAVSGPLQGTKEKRVRVLYSFAAIKPTHLNAECWEELVVLNDMFDWWLCRNDTGEVGLLPSNYLEVLDVEDSAAAERTPEVFEDVLPTWAIRKRIKEICSLAVEKRDLHSLTYMRVRKELEKEFGAETFAFDKVSCWVSQVVWTP
eukprot:m.108589 g.108589  ORF g.108589 m.108589 type:complete len:238 (+) comp21223_c0_seq8:151-864(+)